MFNLLFPGLQATDCRFVNCEPNSASETEDSLFRETGGRNGEVKGQKGKREEL